jgi:hypothetical protein
MAARSSSARATTASIVADHHKIAPIDNDDITAKAMKHYSMSDDEWKVTVKSMLVTDKKNFQVTYRY